MKFVTEILQSSCSKQQEKVIDIEYNNLVHNSVIEQVDKLPVNKYTITRKVIYKEEENKNEDFLKYYTYVVVRDFLQIPDENFMETFALVAKFAILYVYLALVAYLDWNLEQIDIVATFLNRELKKEIYIRVLKEF